MALIKSGYKTNFGLKLEEEKTVEREGEKRRREEGRRRRRGRASKAKLQKGMELLTWYGSLVLLVNGLSQT